jgi:hypothetical protein
LQRRIDEGGARSYAAAAQGRWINVQTSKQRRVPGGGNHEAWGSQDVEVTIFASLFETDQEREGDAWACAGSLQEPGPGLFSSADSGPEARTQNQNAILFTTCNPRTAASYYRSAAASNHYSPQTTNSSLQRTAEEGMRRALWVPPRKPSPSGLPRYSSSKSGEGRTSAPNV